LSPFHQGLLLGGTEEAAFGFQAAKSHPLRWAVVQQDAEESPCRLFAFLDCVFSLPVLSTSSDKKFVSIVFQVEASGFSADLLPGCVAPRARV
jgi:hypothetical protein